MITRKELHDVEMKLVSLCENNEVMKEAIINEFTDLLNKVKEWLSAVRKVVRMKQKYGHLIKGICAENIGKKDVIKAKHPQTTA